MHPDSFRFRPPACELPVELIWTLSRAFGPLPGPALDLERPAQVVPWACRLALRERIASRLPRQDAERELPAEIVDAFWRAREVLAARTLLLQELLDRVAGRAAEIGTAIVAVKGIALLESGAADWGSRPLLDLDLLVAGDRAPDLHRSLESAGLQRSGFRERQHLAPLADPRLGEVELHLHLPGLVVSGKRPATGEDLRRAGLTRPSERLEGLELPAAPLLAGHALAHALDQHGLSPTSYPVTRLVADLIDLAATADHSEVRGWLRRSVSARELGAAEALRGALDAGEPGAAGEDGNALLRHTALAFSSPRYRRQLRRRAALRALRRRQWSKFRSELYRRANPGRRLE